MRIIRKHKLTIIGIVLVIINFLVKGLFLANNSLGGDEPFSVYHAQMDIISIIQLLSAGNNPPLYEILLHFWIKIFGISEFSVRFPSLLFSCISLWFIYKIGHSYLNKRIALYASLQFIFSKYHIVFAHEAIVYSFLGMLTIISMYYFMGIVYDYHKNAQQEVNEKLKKRTTTHFILLTLVNTLIIYSHYIGFFVVWTQVIFLLGNKNLLSKHWKKILLSLSLMLILYIPNILVIWLRFIEFSKGTWVRPPEGFESIYNMLWSFSNIPAVTVCVITLVSVSLLKFIVRYKKEQKKPLYVFVIFWFAFIFLGMFSISYWIPMFLDWYVMPAAIAFPLLLGICMDYVIKKPKYNYIIPVILCLLFIMSAKPNITNKRNVRECVEKIKEIKQTNTLVIISPSTFMLNFSYYYNITFFKNYHSQKIYSRIHQALISENIYAINDIKEIDLKPWHHIAYVDAAADFSSPNNNIKKELDAHYHLKNTFQFYEIFNVFEYKKK